MQYGWYLLDEAKRGLIRSNALRDVVPYGPFHVELQPVAANGALMDFARFAEVVDELAAMNLASVRFAGGGEPLAHPRFVEMVRYVASRGAAVAEVVTDGAGLDDEMARALLEVRAHTLVVDLAGAGSPAVDSLRRMRDERNKRGWHLPKLVCRLAIARGSAEGARLEELARELGAGRVVFAPAGGEAPSLAAAAADAPPPLVMLSRANPDAPARWSGDRHCFIPWYHMLVDARFDVWPCRYLEGEGFRPLGNVRDAAAAEVWNGPRAREYRAEFAAAMLDRPFAGRYLGERCRSCDLRPALADDRFYEETERWIARHRAGMSAPTFPTRASEEGFGLPALRALRERFPLATFERGTMEAVVRVHAEAEMARIEALRLRVRAADLEARATLLERQSGDAAASEASRVEAAAIKREIAEIDVYVERLFEEAGRVGSDALVAAAPPPFESMLDYLRRLHELDPRVSPDVDHTYVIWTSLFRTLADFADMSQIHRVMGVGVGYEGPEVHYNDHFAEHYCLDLVDYSAKNPKLTFITANIEEHVPFPDAYFDLVYSHSVFEHLKNMPAAVEEIDRLVALGKYIYITVSPLYYSPAGAHVNHPVRLSHWEHLDPASEYYMLDSPEARHRDSGWYLNKMTIADFLAAVGRVGWQILHFSVRIVHPRDVPAELRERFSLVDLSIEEYRFVGRKVIPKAEGIEW